MFGAAKTKDLTPQQLKAALDAGTVLLVDVREADEFAVERIPGAVNMPLSTFQPASVPDGEGRTLVLQCLGGKRSAMAVDQCRRAGLAIDTHLDGGLAAWKAAGLPTMIGAARA